jgi:hypothetical protein
MEDQPKLSAKSIMLNYGLMLGFISIIVALVNYVFGDLYKPHWILIVVSLLLSTAVIVLGIKKLKEFNGGFLSVGQAIKIGLGIALVSALIYAVYLAVFFNFIETAYFENVALVQEQTIIEKYPNLTDEQLEGAIKNTAMFNSTGANVTMSLMFSLFFGLIVSLIAGLIMKRSQED